MKSKMLRFFWIENEYGKETGNAKERKIAMEALVGITSGAGVECLSAKMPEDRALL